MTPTDPNLGGIDLPGSPDFAIDNGLLAPPVGGRFGDCDEPFGLDGQDWKGDPAHAVDIDRRHEGLPNSADAKVARTLNGTDAVEQLGTDRRHGNSSKLDPAASAPPTLTELSALTAFFGGELDRENGAVGGARTQDGNQTGRLSMIGPVNDTPTSFHRQRSVES
ncbi:MULTISPECIES: hypothetical protein [unclassified Bradyrhizobium]|uniref:hypothetical protein n=1 Tax=unclassified Bradyrhizobium TaxID=2631580 RepID=UPI001FFB5C58|nr:MULTISPECIES: hypothetical protein [unclassified Bradyrhizobium]